MTRQEAISVLVANVMVACDRALFDISTRRCVEDALDMAIEALEPKTGHWTDREVFTNDENTIDAWQTCCCSVCQRYDTRPYMYYFGAPNYCSWCGTKMEGEEDGQNTV